MKTISQLEKENADLRRMTERLRDSLTRALEEIAGRTKTPVDARAES